MGIFTLHGIPVSLVESDSWSPRTTEVKQRLLPRIEAVLRAKGYARAEARFAAESFADSLEDPDDRIVFADDVTVPRANR